MSNKHADNNDKQTQTSAMQQQSDEAFINELYNEVSEENQSQPSELLDQRIINAAHKATQKTKKTKIKSTTTWYSAIATAASLTLVVSLVVMQKSNVPPNEQAEMRFMKEPSFQKSVASSDKNDSLADTEVMNEQSFVRAMHYKEKTQLAKQKSVERMMVSPPANSPLLAKLAQTPEGQKKHKIIFLSIKQYHQYILSNKDLAMKNKWLWSLDSESDTEYTIDIFQNDQQPLQYRLDKSIFEIKGLAKHNSKQALSKISILNSIN